jgi:hypothetical protein
LNTRKSSSQSLLRVEEPSLKLPRNERTEKQFPHN